VTPVIPLPDPLPQPAPAWLMWALLQLTFLLHVLAMNVVFGGSILALHWRFGRRSSDATARASMVQAFVKALPVAVAAAVTFGVAPLLFVQVLYGRVFFTSSILMGWLWLAVVPLVILGYSGAYLLAFRGEALGSRARWVAVAVAAVFAGVAFLYVTNVTRSLRPDTFAGAYRASGAGLTFNLGDPTFWPRYLHMLLGAVAVAAMGAALYGLARRKREPELAAWAMRRGTVVFGVATAVNVLVGVWLLATQPRGILIRLLGEDPRAMTALAVAIFLAVAAASLVPLALGARNATGATGALAAVLLATLVAMVLLRDQVRQLALRLSGFEPPAWVAPQWGPFAVFALFLVAAIVAIAWMARALVRGSAAGA
jgi:hypothetical protein